MHLSYGPLLEKKLILEKKTDEYKAVLKHDTSLKLLLKSLVCRLPLHLSLAHALLSNSSSAKYVEVP